MTEIYPSQRTDSAVVKQREVAAICFQLTVNINYACLSVIYNIQVTISAFLLVETRRFIPTSAAREIAAAKHEISSKKSEIGSSKQ